MGGTPLKLVARQADNGGTFWAEWYNQFRERGGGSRWLFAEKIICGKEKFCLRS